MASDNPEAMVETTVFDAVQIELGSLLTGHDGNSYYPVVKGLEAGDRVVTAGSYLLDAETKVSGAAGSTGIHIGDHNMLRK